VGELAEHRGMGGAIAQHRQLVGDEGVVDLQNAHGRESTGAIGERPTHRQRACGTPPAGTAAEVRKFGRAAWPGRADTGAMTGTDPLRRLLDAVLEAEGASLEEMAADAHLSPFHFQRTVRRGAGESPSAMRRRVRLERAAWTLQDGTSVTDAA